ncbi:AAA family ATPase [Microbacterium sp. MMO-56]|uniref:AAA family ATPase n=1 Tax=Microbacterium sp. MMO-56 TaxID=3081281 RepID=UPI003016FC5A
MSDYDDAYADQGSPAPVSPAQLAERYVLGAIMADPRVLRDVQVVLVPGDFEDLRLGSIYRGICGMVVAKEAIDYLSVFDHLAGWDVRGVDLSQLSAWSSEVPSTANVGYYARAVRERALARSLERVGQGLVGTAEPAVALSNALTALAEIRDRDTVSSTPARTLREILAVPEEEDTYDWVIPDVVERRDRLMLTAGEGVGKSVMLRQLAVLPAAGIHPFTFGVIEPIRALVVDVENSERQWRRAIRRMADQAAIRGPRDPRDHVAVEFLPKSDITQAQVLGDIHRRIDEVQPDLVVIGPMYRLAPAMKDEEDASPVLAALDTIRERGVAMLIEAHAGHETARNGVRNLRPRGSSALLGWPEFGLGLQKDQEKSSFGGFSKYSLIRWRGDRDARPFPAKFTRGQIWPWEPLAGY